MEDKKSKINFLTSVASPILVAIILWFFQGTSKVEDNQQELLLNQKLIQQDIDHIHEKLDYNSKWIKQSDETITDHEKRIIQLEAKQKHIEKELFTR